MIFLKAIILGFLVAAPVGPVNLLCMRRTLLFGKKAGLVSGFGSAMADTLYASIAAYSLTTIASFVSQYDVESRFLGIVIIIIISWRIYYSVPKPYQQSGDTHLFLWKHFISAFFLTLMNPSVIFSLIFLFSATHLQQHPIYAVAGIGVGAMVWWAMLSFGVSYIHVSNDRFIIINKVAAVLMFVLGIVSFVVKR